jgi:hypothetical protein
MEALTTPAVCGCSSIPDATLDQIIDKLSDRYDVAHSYGDGRGATKRGQEPNPY